MSALSKYLAKLASNPETAQYGKMGNEVMRNAIINKFYDMTPSKLTRDMLSQSNKSMSGTRETMNQMFESGTATKDYWDNVAKEMVRLKHERTR